MSLILEIFSFSKMNISVCGISAICAICEFLVCVADNLLRILTFRKWVIFLFFSIGYTSMHDSLATSFPGRFVQEKKKNPLILKVSATYSRIS